MPTLEPEHAPGQRICGATVLPGEPLAHRHGYTGATGAEPSRPGNAYVREDQILPRLAAVAILLASGGQPGGNGTVQVTAPAERPRTSSAG